MRDVLNEITDWTTQGETIALATVIQTWGSSPRGVGANMAITGGGEITGSVSGGCVEGAVAEAGLTVLKTGLPQLLSFGVADATAWEVGLSCGGSISVFVRPLNSELIPLWQRAKQNGESIALATVLHGPKPLLGKELALLEDGSVHGAINSELDHQIIDLTQNALTSGKPKRVQLETNSIEIFINVEQASPTLVIVGGGHIAIPLVDYAKTLGYLSIVIDPRRMFATQSRFPHADRLIQSWPNKAFAEITINTSTAIAVLTHDPKIDDPALKIALKSKAFYIGVLGSKKTHRARRQRLLDAEMSAAEIDRLHAPIGLDLGGRSPEEIALAIMAEIVEARNKR